MALTTASTAEPARLPSSMRMIILPLNPYSVTSEKKIFGSWIMGDIFAAASLVATSRSALTSSMGRLLVTAKGMLIWFMGGSWTRDVFEMIELGMMTVSPRALVMVV